MFRRRHRPVNTSPPVITKAVALKGGAPVPVVQPKKHEPKPTERET